MVIVLYLHGFHFLHSCVHTERKLMIVFYTLLLPLDPQILGDVDHPLLDIVRECLSNVVDRRPTAVAILERVNELGEETEDDLMATDKLHMIEQLQRVQAECEELQVCYKTCTVCTRCT